MVNRLRDSKLALFLLVGTLTTGCSDIVRLNTTKTEEEKAIASSAPAYDNFSRDPVEEQRRGVVFDGDAEKELQDVQKLISTGFNTYQSNPGSLTSLENALELANEAKKRGEALLEARKTGPGDMRYTKTFHDLYGTLSLIYEGLGRTEKAEKCKDNQEILFKALTVMGNNARNGSVSNAEIERIREFNHQVIAKYDTTKHIEPAKEEIKKDYTNISGNISGLVGLDNVILSGKQTSSVRIKSNSKPIDKEDPFALGKGAKRYADIKTAEESAVRVAYELSRDSSGLLDNFAVGDINGRAGYVPVPAGNIASGRPRQSPREMAGTFK